MKLFTSEYWWGRICLSHHTYIPGRADPRKKGTPVSASSPPMIRWSSLENAAAMTVPVKVRCPNIKHCCEVDESQLEVVSMETMASRYVSYHTNAFAFTVPSFALLCDWIMLDRNEMYGNRETPRTIYVHSPKLSEFVELLPHLKSPFILVTAYNDETLPINVDVRQDWKVGGFRDLWDRIVRHPALVHWFAENRIEYHPKVMYT
jgi:hypothetical protein